MAGSAGHQLEIQQTASRLLEAGGYELNEGASVFVKAGAAHRFVGYGQLIVLVIFEKQPT